MHLARWVAVLSVLFGICIGAEKSASAKDPIALATVVGMPLVSGDGQDGFLTLLAQDAFARIGLTVEIIRLPGERALSNANDGIEDGELFRIGGMEKIYPNLIPIPEPMMSFDFVGFTKPEKSFPVTDWTSLEPYVVGIINGWKIYEKNVLNTMGRTEVRNMDLLFNLLRNDRADVILADLWQGLYVSKQLSIPVVTLEPPFSSKEMFMYLHKRHKDLVPQLAAALAMAKNDGTYNRLYRQTLNSYATQIGN